ncbi:MULTISPECIES: serine--tRNA ligase [unclassified Spirosoma]|uniref:serine--tRNA ligase n=1 Tax=unclassified Spirosoma TaxID=2621999 RepID=UPI00095B6C3C|nr:MULTISPECIES: serine--tRNA ligase [unclassified Spirosoma]MBN8824082.1 serine--tRNA ligase [Spirosoma sp.]OJW70480.1 MAG: serine--tRNA ligase [Spirosoma sp. 48-14]
MLQLPFIRENKEAVLTGLHKRHFANAEATIDQVLTLDQQRRDTQRELDDTLAQSNAKAGQIGALMKAGDKAAADAAKAETAELKVRSKDLGETLRQIEIDLQAVLVTIPNIPHSSVPEGRSADDNEVVLENGEKPSLYEGAQPHWELIKKYDIIDFELGVKISGAGFPVYKGKGARIQRALINFFLDEALKAGYLEVQPPIVVNEDSGFGTGQLPDKEGQMYYVTEDKLYLIPTAEVPITNLYRDVILPEGQLPIKNVGYTPCFRREAGSWGAHVRGLNRLHQFDKVEIVRIEKPEKSYAALEEMSLHVQGLLQKLELPYRVLRLCGGDMGFTSALTYDMEVWSAAQQRWLEVSSVSNFETYQANRLKLRSKLEGKMQLMHTLNGSALALPRILASILENNQTPEGVRIPNVLVPYCGFEMID